MLSVKVAVILPSRGLIFSQTAQEVLDNLKGIPHKIYFAHRRPLPACFNEPLEKALKDKDVTHIWFVEDDMILPPNTLQKLLEADANAATCDYPVNQHGRGSVFYDQGGNVVFCGTGCLLVKRSVFDNLKKPYFTDSIRWTSYNYGDAVKLVAKPNEKGEGYGLHDITFCLRLWKQGIKIQVLKMRLGQRKLLELGKAGSNDGAHKIENWHKIVKNLRLKELQKQPRSMVSMSKLVTVIAQDGKEITAKPHHAETLVAQGLATYPPKSYLILDDSEAEL